MNCWPAARSGRRSVADPPTPRGSETVATPSPRPVERDIALPAVLSEGLPVSRLAIVACWLAVLVRVVLVLGLIAMPIALASTTGWAWIEDMILGVFIIPMAAYMALAFTLRCPSCRRCFLVEPRAKHPTARKIGHLDHWGTVVRDVLRQRQFTCMYCGAPCRVR